MKRFRNAILGIFLDIIDDYSRHTCSTPEKGELAGVDRCFINNHHAIVIATDRSGGMRALMSVWAYLARNREIAPERVHFFYIFLAPSRVALRVHRELWDFAVVQARHALGDQLQATFTACVRPSSLDCHKNIPLEVLAGYQAQLEAQGILERFRQVLREGHPPSVDSSPVALINQKRRDS